MSSNGVKAAEESKLRGVQLTPIPQAPRPWIDAEPHRAAEAQEVMKSISSGFCFVQWVVVFVYILHLFVLFLVCWKAKYF